MNVQSWHGVNIQAAQIDEVRALFAQVFGGAMSAAVWHWKYADGRGLATGTRAEDGRLLAHYGGTSRALLVQGQAFAAVQLGDVMVAQDVRAILSRRGPFATAAKLFLDQHVGTDSGFALGFGFPNERAAKLGKALGLYEMVDAVQQVHWPAWSKHDSQGARWRWRLAAIDWADTQTAQWLDGLWAQQRATPWAQNLVLPVRDSAWWRHRFANHPEGPYRCFWVYQRWTGTLLGAVALRPQSAPDAPWELLDWLCAPQHLNAVLAAARLLCLQQGALGGMMAWLSQPLVAHLLPSCPRLADGRVQPVCSVAITQRRTPKLDALAVAQRGWWLTGGDTDFR